ncbi:hypothetical protein CAEBREN_22217 [Caenorhabditis brenneri]|uniref:Uncharacterized protein n=1 Tax=Caenorhabditis brenneri TaxID=135651 RepID=G0NIF5_CAEBE|nr:hypothetical protein CAEBREN_22217 [Caenorhabditis brenneri]
MHSHVTKKPSSYKFATCDVQFWSNDQRNVSHGRVTAARATIRGKETLIDQPMEEEISQKVMSSGTYSVSKACGNEQTRDVQKEVQRTFYTTVTKPQR